MIAGQEHLTPYLKKKFTNMKRDEVIVWWYGEEKSFNRTKVGNVDLLGEKCCDATRAAVSDEVMMKYYLALAYLRDWWLSTAQLSPTTLLHGFMKAFLNIKWGVFEMIQSIVELRMFCQVFFPTHVKYDYFTRVYLIILHFFSCRFFLPMQFCSLPTL